MNRNSLFQWVLCFKSSSFWAHDMHKKGKRLWRNKSASRSILQIKVMALKLLVQKFILKPYHTAASYKGKEWSNVVSTAIRKVMCFIKGYLRLKHSWCKLSPYVFKWIDTYPLSIIAQLSCLFINRTMFSNTLDVNRPGRAHSDIYLAYYVDKYNSTTTHRSVGTISIVSCNDQVYFSICILSSRTFLWYWYNVRPVSTFQNHFKFWYFNKHIKTNIKAFNEI